MIFYSLIYYLFQSCLIYLFYIIPNLMLYIIKNIDYEKIKLKYLNGKKLYKLYYNLNKHINIIGIPISFKYDKN